eukprot:gene38665-62209_t
MSEQLPPLITTPPGVYKHYKGMLYEVIGTVRHSEDLSPMTLYRALYGEHGLWVRPAAMFNEDVVIDGVRQPRFQLQPTRFLPYQPGLQNRLCRAAGAAAPSGCSAVGEATSVGAMLRHR